MFKALCRKIQVVGVATLLLFMCAPAVRTSALATPGWWNGDCNSNNNPGSYALGASLHGVKACGGGSARTVRFFNNAWGQEEWQCVELAMRYLYLAHGIAPYKANGKDVVWNYPGTILQKVANNGNSVPKIGDVLSHDTGDEHGHTSVVTAVNVDGAGNGSVTVMEQNSSSTGSRTINVASKVLARSTTGWLHDPVDQAPPVVVPPPSVGARVNNNLYSGDTPTLLSNTASSGNWKISGNRIGLLDSAGLWVRDSGSWSLWGASDVEEFQVSPTMVAARVGTNLYTNTSGSTAWTLVSNTASQGNWKLSHNRLALLDSNGLWVKDGTSAWVQWGASDVEEFQVSSTRVAARVGTNLYAGTSPVLVSNSATAGKWKLSGNKLALLDSNGLWVKDGDLGWVQWGASDVEEFQVSPTRVAARVGTNLYSGATPSLVSNSATAGKWKLANDRLALLDSNGLWVKDGTSAWVQWGSSDVEEFQMADGQ